MLRTFRAAANTWVVKLMFVLLIGSFGVWGIGDMVTRSGHKEELATVAGTEISRAAVDQEFRRNVDRLRRAMGGNFTTEQAVKMGMVDQTVQNLIQQELVRRAAVDAGLNVGDDLVRRRIAEEKAFRNQAGVFDAAIYREVLARSGLTEAGYVALLRDDLSRQMLTEAVMAGAAPPQQLADALFAHRGERRVLEVLTLENKAAGDVGAPDAATVEAYYKDHPIPFTAPEYRTVTVAQLLLDDLAKEIKLSDDEIKAAYDERRAEFETPEKRKLRMTVTDDAAKAKALAADAQVKGLDNAAKDAGVQVVDMGEVTAGDLPGIGEAIFKLPQGVGAEPLQSPFGWHVVSIDAVTPGTTQPLAAVREVLAKTIARERASDRGSELSNQFDDKLASGASLEEVGKALGLRLTKIAAIDATGKDPAGKAVTGDLVDPAKVAEIAFTLAPNASSPLTESAGGDMFAVHLDNIAPPALRPLDSVRDGVIVAWTAEQQAAKTAEKAKTLEAALTAAPADGGAAVAKTAGAAYALTPPMARDAAASVPPEVAAKLFAGKVGTVAVGDTGEAQVVARLKEIVPADAKAQAEELDALKRSLAQGLENDLMAQYLAGLQQRYPVVLHRDRIARLYSQN